MFCVRRPLGLLLNLVLIVVFVFEGCHTLQDDDLVQLRNCYDSAADLFHVYPQLNSTFKIKIKDKCLGVPSINIDLVAFDPDILEQVNAKQLDELDKTKCNRIKIIRNVMLVTQNDLSNFDSESKFKFAIAFLDHTGVIEIAVHPKVFNFYGTPVSSSTEIALIFFLGILLLITCILLAILVYINYFGSAKLQSYLIFWHRGTGNSRRQLMKNVRVSITDEDTCLDPTFTLERSNVIPLSELLVRLPAMLDSDAIKDEYDSVSRAQLFTWNYGRAMERRSKNRYGNLLPYDHSRVILEGPDGDYLNGNYVDGYDGPKQYIATQGPIEATVNDFWRCVWQNRCQQIVILTRLEESGKRKCDKYWPEQEQFYGEINVVLEKQEMFADYQIRHFRLERNGDNLEVIQYHFLSWPDHNVPLYATSVISFVNAVRNSELYMAPNTRILVHCSAGIGRTGAFILLDCMFRMAESEGKIDVLKQFCKLRAARVNMVEKFAQYRFCYQVLFEALSHEPTDIECPAFDDYLQEMTRYMDNGHMKLEQLFDVLNVMSSKKLPADVCVNGLQHLDENRVRDVVPPDYARFILPSSDDYINAVYVNGYRRSDAYLVTQIPFENGRDAFWRMVDSAKASLIVLLNDTPSPDLIYWPTEVGLQVQYGDDLRVCLIKEEHSARMLVRQFQIEPSHQTVRQIQLRGGLQNRLTMVELKERLDMMNISSSNTPLIVQCTDGIQQCGVFCALDFIFDRIKEEQQIDVFLAVQKVRSNRPEFIATFDEFLHLHNIAYVYVQSFDNYANFK